MAKRKATLQGLQKRLKALAGASLGDEDTLNRDFLTRVVDARLEGMSFDEEREPINSDSSFFTTPDYVASSTRVRDLADAEAWIARLEALPAYYDVETANARRGLATGFVQPRRTVEAVIVQAKAHADAAPSASPLLAPFATLPSTIPAARQEALRARALAVVADRIKPAERQFLAFLQTEYLPKARTTLATRELPDGERYYRYLVRRYTTTDMTPDEVHALGLKEVARIRAEMDKTIAETGFKGSFPEFLAYLRTDPKFYPTSRQQLLEKASEIAKRIDDKLPGEIGKLPRLTYGVRPVPPEIEDGYTSGRYFNGSPQLGVAGGYMVNTSHLNQRPLYELPALTLHEAVPGHHIQIALAQERTDLPWFRRNADVTAFVEGWALYSEHLGQEMGIYRDAYEQFGRLSFEMWRACRLVADTGIHWKGWSREKAKTCFMENSALAEKNVDVELDRYISWPGQALAYKIGQLKMLELRRRAEARLGDKFDVRAFHDEILDSGPLPLNLLDRRTDAWIAAGGRPQPAR